MKKKLVAFIIANQKVEKDYQMCLNSLRKFHSEEELPVIRIDDEKIASYHDDQFFYRAKPIIAKELLQEYETVIGLDADQIFLGSISHIWKGDFDVAVVNNSNPKEFKTFPYQFMNIHPLSYVNNGLVVMKSEAFVNFWYDLCHSILYNGWQMREQDGLNLLVHSGHYQVRRLDEGEYYHGLAAKQYTPYTRLEGKKVVLPKNSEDNWPDRDKQIVCHHFAGGHNDPMKGNYRIMFPEEVVKYIDTLVKP